MRKKVKISIIVIIVVIFIIAFSQATTSYKKQELVDENVDYKVEKTYDVASKNLEGQVLIDEHEGNRMFMDLKTTNVLIKDSKNKIVFESLPNEKSTPFIINFYKGAASSIFTLDGKKDSINEESYSVEKLSDGGALVNYTLGDDTLPIGVLPQFVSPDNYKAVEANISAEDAQYLKLYYTFIQQKDHYVRAKEIKPSKIKDVYNVLYTKGQYTNEMFEADNKKYDALEEAAVEPLNYQVPIKYSFDSVGNFNFLLDMDKFSASGVRETDSIDIMPNLVQTKDGEFIVPDGAGAVVDTSLPHIYNTYTKPFGKLDDTVLAQKEGPEEGLSLPMFASSDYLVAINDGSEAMNLRMNLSENSNVIFPSVSVAESVFFELDSQGAGIEIFSDNVTGKIDISYQISDSKMTYNDVANAYSEYIMKVNSIKEIQRETSVVLEFIMTYEYTEYLLGIPYDNLRTATTYEEVSNIVTELNLPIDTKLVFKGWTDEGLKQSGHKYKNSSLNGTESELAKLQEENEVFLGTNFINIYKSYMDVKDSKHLAFSPANKVSIDMPQYNSTMQQNENIEESYFIKPKLLSDLVDKSSKSLEGNTGLYIDDLSSVAYADYNSNSATNVTDSEKIIEENLAKLSEKFNLTLSNPINNRFIYGNYLTDLPSLSSGNNIFDYEAPILQLVLNDFKNYSYASINVDNTGDYHKEFMKALETQSDLKFTISQDTPNKFLGTEYEEYYGTHYETIKNTITELSAKYSEFIKITENSKITSHKLISNNVYLVEYENGSKALFNYGTNPYNYKGNVIESSNYKVWGDK